MTMIAGTKVIIFQKVTDEPGWANSWSSHMDKHVGTGEILQVHNTGAWGVTLRNLLNGKGGGDYAYPPSSLLEVFPKKDIFTKSFSESDTLFLRDMKNIPSQELYRFISEAEGLLIKLKSRLLILHMLEGSEYGI